MQRYWLEEMLFESLTWISLNLSALSIEMEEFAFTFLFQIKNQPLRIMRRHLEFLFLLQFMAWYSTLKEFCLSWFAKLSL
jgi:hypothetical protein